MTHLLNELERKLAGRHEPRTLRIVPSDHCHLGVLGPRDPIAWSSRMHLIQTTRMRPAQEGSQDEPRTAGPRSAQPLAAADDQDDSAETGFGEAERIVAEQRGANRDSTRRPPSSLGFEIVATPDPVRRDLELTVEVKFCVYTQHFPTFEEEREGVGGRRGKCSKGQPYNPMPPAAPQRANVSLIEAYVRRNVTVPPITVRIDPSRGNHCLDDGSVIQQSLDAVLNGAAADPTIWRDVQGNATIPVQAPPNT